ncbi:helix-turn-helix domain-containing protein [Microbacterium protaetiae]|uniref:Helix-turn-helix domain-containing protein n=1 Tax=Microbacterium protaetiae TaxID=2509458 RepID=A0A4P6ED88_9MICO|nr:BTAD domain-containing putative transcriptional regulator [Microbacterium protaetiae]QAY60220.1 helix-turn-helix domain-containing protein [Microbacterium protaetiae]
MTEGGLRAAVLGPVTVEAQRGHVELSGPNARALVAALVLAGGTIRSADALADDIWGDDPPKNPRAALQTLVSRVRAAAGSEAVRSLPGGYALGDAETDLAEAARLLDGAAASDDALPALDKALALWRGEPGADLEPAPVAVAVADAASTLRSRLDTARAEALSAAGRVDEAVASLSARAAAHPYDEAAHAQLMRTLADAGRTAEALSVFAELRARLRDDLGADPGEDIAQLNAALLRGDPARTRVRIGLQAAPNELLGRGADLAAVAALLDHSRVVTVLGTGGLGKTRLVQAVAAASHAPAVVMVPLAGVRADDDVAPTIATVLGISEASPGGRLADIGMRPDLRARVIGLLGEQQALVVLDNCEQVIDGVAGWVADMLASVPSLHVLTTSRTPLAMAGEAVYPLAPLALDETGEAPAVQLFLERARAVRPGASLPIDVVTRLCTHLDGLPLAIELAAARVRTMTPQQIEQRLQDRFALLTTGDRTAPERHRTLEAVIGWSWDLLDDQARRAMVVLAVLPDGFGADTAAGVLGEPVDDVIDRLVSQSLLLVAESRVGHVRFRMLETIREYALARLADEPDGIESAWDRVTSWAWRFSVERLNRAFERETHAEIRDEHANLIAVLRRAIDRGDDETTILLFALLAQTWMVMGAFTEMASFALAAFEVVQRAREGRVPVEALVTTLIVATFVGQAEAGAPSLRFIARIRILRRRHPDMNEPIGAFAGALIDILAAGIAGGVDAVNGVLQTMAASSHPATQLVGETLMSQFAENEGRPEVALASSLRSWELARASGAEWFAAMAASSVAQLASQTDQPALALEWLDRADRGYELFGAAQQQHQIAWLRGTNLVTLGDIAAAREVFAALAASNELTEDGLETASIGVYGLAETARREGDLDAAAAHFDRALSLFSSSPQRGSPWYQMMMAGALSAVVFDGLLTPERRNAWARRLRTRTLAVMRQRQGPGMADHPVLGTVLMGWSAWALQEAGDERGLEALVLAERLGARQDLWSLRWQEHEAHAVGLVGAERLEAARAAASTLSHDRLLPRALDLLRRAGDATRPAP